MDKETQEQNKKQNYDWLKGYQFVKGQSGNPGGRPKGRKSLKTFAREYLETLPDEEKIEYLKTLPSEIVWKMAEGNPSNEEKHSGEIEIKIDFNESGFNPKVSAKKLSEGTPTSEQEI